MRSALVPSLLSALLLAGCKPSTSAPAGGTVVLETEEQKTLYALGLLMGGNLARLNVTPAELELVKKGLTDAATNQKPQVDLAQYGPKVQSFAQARAAAGNQAEKAKGVAFQEAAAKEQGAVKSASGLVFRSLKAGVGPSPTATDTVRVHYEGKLIDGTVFDSSMQRGQPLEFSLSGVIPCWTEGVQKMKVGEKAKLVCPSEIAYGERGQGKIPPGATLVFEVELLEIKK